MFEITVLTTGERENEKYSLGFVETQELIVKRGFELTEPLDLRNYSAQTPYLIYTGENREGEGISIYAPFPL